MRLHLWNLICYGNITVKLKRGCCWFFVQSRVHQCMITVQRSTWRESINTLVWKLLIKSYQANSLLGSVQILQNQLLHNSGRPPPCNHDHHDIVGGWMATWYFWQLEVIWCLLYRQVSLYMHT